MAVAVAEEALKEGNKLFDVVEAYVYDTDGHAGLWRCKHYLRSCGAGDSRGKIRWVHALHLTQKSSLLCHAWCPKLAGCCMCLHFCGYHCSIMEELNLLRTTQHR